MLDQAKSSANPQRTLAGEVPQPPEADPTLLPEGLSRSAPDESLYSIRVADGPGTLCAACGKQETGSGPVGYMDDEPICDLCLLERSTDLGLLLAVISIVRAYATSSGTPQQHSEALEELGAFARIYHQVASKSWPARVLQIPGFSVKADNTTH